MNTLYNFLFPQMSLWNKIKENFILKEIILDDFICVKENNNISTEKNFIFSNNRLYYKKDNCLKGFINLEFINILFNDSFNCINFSNGSKYFELFFNDSNKYLQWKEELLKIGILNNFHENYKVIDIIGHGGTAKVFKIKNYFNNKFYAAKCFNKHKLSKNSKGLQSLINEIRIMRDLRDSNNCIKMFEIYESKNTFYLILEYINYGNLLELIKNDNLKIICNDIFLQIINGLQEIHNKKIIHRDLKPENIFINIDESNNFKIKIGDFGLSNYIDKDFIFFKCGTPGYIAPEIINYNDKLIYKIDFNSDIYSLGCLFYFLLTKSPLYKFIDVKDLIHKNRNNLFILDKEYFENHNNHTIIFQTLNIIPEHRISLDELRKYFNN